MIITKQKLWEEKKNFILFSFGITFVIVYIVMFFGYNSLLVNNPAATLAIISYFCFAILLLYICNIVYLIVIHIKYKNQRITQIQPQSQQPESNNIVIGNLIIE